MTLAAVSELVISNPENPRKKCIGSLEYFYVQIELIALVLRVLLMLKS